MKIRTPGRLTSNLAEINITPLVDVMLVLLIIFMVTAPMMQSGITVKLPTAESRNNPSPGGLVLTLTKDRYVYMNDQIVNLYFLESRLKSFFFNREKKVVFLKADKSLTYGYIIEVMDIVKNAGVDTVGMIVEPKPRQ
ncbi:MAG: biopolymer transporter ExbD [Candidatus Aminicenantes bacterium]|nr:biopolymer transporter ExbD [Candidatus Aminicenantes bacterium]